MYVPYVVIIDNESASFVNPRIVLPSSRETVVSSDVYGLPLLSLGEARQDIVTGLLVNVDWRKYRVAAIGVHVVRSCR